MAPATPAANTNVTIDEANGFSPNVLNIAVGQRVTWTNNGNNVHTITSDSGYIPSFDSGGLGKGQSFSFQFTRAGTFTYHSATEPIYYTDSNVCSCTLTKYQFTGTIVAS